MCYSKVKIAKKRDFTFFAKKEFIYLQLIKQLSVSYFVKGESFMFKKYITTIIFVSLLFVSTDAMSQPGTPCTVNSDCPEGQACSPGGRCRPVGPGLPIDGGLAILLAAGIALGIKKLRD